ncbi:MAG: hypothetical protein ACE5JN_11515 [Candidatus Methylomirabilia bacterium]
MVNFSIQPRIDELLAQAEGEAIPEPIAGQIAPLRLRRKRLAPVCLLAALFVWRVYRSDAAPGWRPRADPGP